MSNFNTINKRGPSPFVGMLAVERAALLGLFGVFAVWVGVVNFTSGANDLALYLSFLALLLALSFPFVVYRKTWGFFHPLLFFVLWYWVLKMLLPHLGVFMNGLDSHLGLPSMSGAQLNTVVVQATLLQVLGIGGMYLGYFATKGRIKLFSVHWPQTASRRRVITVIVAVACLSTFMVVVLAERTGGLGHLILSHKSWSAESLHKRLSAYWFLVPGWLTTACVLWLVVRPTDWRRPMFLTAFTLGLVLVWLPSGSRSAVIVPVLMAASVVLMHYKRIRYSWILALGVFAVVVVGVGGQFRSATRGASSIDSIQLNTGVVHNIGNGLDVFSDYASSSYGPYGIMGKVPRSVDYLYGETYLSVLVGPIPRSIWNNKPHNGGKLYGLRILDSPSRHAPPQTIGEAYWNFGVPGVIAVMFLFGALLKYLAYWYRNDTSNAFVSAFFLLTIFKFQPNSATIYAWGTTIVPAMLMLVFMCGVPRLRRTYGFAHRTGGFNPQRFGG